MTGARKPYIDSFDDPEGPQSLYDPPDEVEDLWFLPDPEEALEKHEMPLPRTDQRKLIQSKDWFAAQGDHAAQLARAALAVGQLDLVVAQIGQGAIERLALREAEALSWANGTPVALDEIGRDRLQARAMTDPQALQQARWAARRLMGEMATKDLRAFLGLHGMASRDLSAGSRHGLPGRASGVNFDEAAEAFLAGVAELVEAHEFTQAAFARFLWRLSDLSPEENQVEGAVWAARLMAQGCLALTFVPIGKDSRYLPSSGIGAFGTFLKAVETGAVAARIELRQLIAWRDRALTGTAPIKGNNPARIIAALMAKPMATTEMIEQAAGVSRDTAERLLARLQDMGLVREVTGAKRFRIWAART